MAAPDCPGFSRVNPCVEVKYPSRYGAEQKTGVEEEHGRGSLGRRGGRRVEPVVLPARSPNLNAHLERFHRSLKAECLECLIFFGEHSLRQAILAFGEHYHRERNHQGLDNKLIDPDAMVGHTSGKIQCRKRLGGLLKYYYRSAA